MTMASSQVATVGSPISEAEMRRYFAPFPVWAIVTAGIGLLIVVVGSASHAGVCVGLGFILLLVGGGGLALNMFLKKPTDEQYDTWVEANTQGMIPHALNRLSLDREDLQGDIMHVRGIVLPGSREATSYHADEVKFKRGKDGRFRYSVNTVRLFFPAEHQLGTFSGIISALNQSSHAEGTAEYFYRDVVGATTNDIQDNVTINKRPYQYRFQMFDVRITSGDTIGTVVRATPVQGKGMIFEVPDSGIDQTMANLRMLLRSKKSGNS